MLSVTCQTLYFLREGKVEGGVLTEGADTTCLEPLVCLSLCNTLL